VALRGARPGLPDVHTCKRQNRAHMGSLVNDDYATLWGYPWTDMPKDSGVLKVFSLP